MHAVCAYFFVAAMLAAIAPAQFHMYTPGAPWPPSVHELDMFGGMIDLCNCSFCAYPAYPTIQSCHLQPGFDVTLCQETPTSVTRTPYIATTHRAGLASASGSISIDCSAFYGPVLGDMRIVYTTNGTLPDIRLAQRGYGASVAFSPSNPTPRIAVRCVLNGSLPSRIAYLTRVIYSEEANGTWCNIFNGDVRYKQMDLPSCEPSLYGSQCDGQSIVSPLPTTPSPNQQISTSPPPPPTTPSEENPTPVVSRTGGGGPKVSPTLLLATGLLFAFFTCLST